MRSTVSLRCQKRPRSSKVTKGPSTWFGIGLGLGLGFRLRVRARVRLRLRLRVRARVRTGEHRLTRGHESDGQARSKLDHGLRPRRRPNLPLTLALALTVTLTLTLTLTLALTLVLIVTRAPTQALALTRIITQGKLEPSDISEHLLEQCLLTSPACCPPVDLLVRTSG